MSRILKDYIGDDDDFRNDFQDEAEFDDDQYASNKNNNNNDDDVDADGRYHASQLVVNLVDAAQVKKGGALRGAARETTSSQATQTKKNHGKKTTTASRESLDACAKVQQAEIAKMRETLQERFTGERVEGAALVCATRVNNQRLFLPVGDVVVAATSSAASTPGVAPERVLTVALSDSTFALIATLSHAYPLSARPLCQIVAAPTASNASLARLKHAMSVALSKSIGEPVERRRCCCLLLVVC